MDDESARGKRFIVGDSQPWMADFWKRVAERDAQAEYDETGKRVVTGDVDADYVRPNDAGDDSGDP
jgi:hypothetical protein